VDPVSNVETAVRFIKCRLQECNSSHGCMSRVHQWLPRCVLDVGHDDLSRMFCSSFVVIKVPTLH
jgi:hypothetical protein